MTQINKWGFQNWISRCIICDLWKCAGLARRRRRHKQNLLKSDKYDLDMIYDSASQDNSLRFDSTFTSYFKLLTSQYWSCLEWHIIILVMDDVLRKGRYHWILFLRFPTAQIMIWTKCYLFSWIKFRFRDSTEYNWWVWLVVYFYHKDWITTL